MTNVVINKNDKLLNIHLVLKPKIAIAISQLFYSQIIYIFLLLFLIQNSGFRCFRRFWGCASPDRVADLFGGCFNTEATLRFSCFFGLKRLLEVKMFIVEQFALVETLFARRFGNRVFLSFFGFWSQ